MIATIINAVAIVVGGLLGLIIKGRFNKKLQAIASQATGLSVLVVGLNTALTQLITQPCNSVLFVISLVVGGLIGTVINVEGRLQALGKDGLKRKLEEEKAEYPELLLRQRFYIVLGQWLL